ncbi:putative mitogen-activated protein kinase [Helianthus annuus]|nr:putative mitogen-activated protein kinase [Helianthus annuus]
MYIPGLVNLESKPFKEPIFELEFDFERRRSTKNDSAYMIERALTSFFWGVLANQCG